jgi:hypothetical protein
MKDIVREMPWRYDNSRETAPETGRALDGQNVSNNLINRATESGPIDLFMERKPKVSFEICWRVGIR